MHAHGDMISILMPRGERGRCPAAARATCLSPSIHPAAVLTICHADCKREAAELPGRLCMLMSSFDLETSRLLNGCSSTELHELRPCLARPTHTYYTHAHVHSATTASTCRRPGPGHADSCGDGRKISHTQIDVAFCCTYVCMANETCPFRLGGANEAGVRGHAYNLIQKPLRVVSCGSRRHIPMYIRAAAESVSMYRCLGVGCCCSCCCG